MEDGVSSGHGNRRHEPLNLGDRDGASQGYQLGQPTATLGCWPTSLSRFSSASSPGRLVSPQALSCSYSSVSAGCVCGSRPGVSWCAATHPWERDLLPPAGGGQSCEQARWAGVPPKLAGAGSPHPRVPHQNSCYGKRFVDFFLFLFFFFLFFFLCSNFPRPPQKALAYHPTDVA